MTSKTPRQQWMATLARASRDEIATLSDSFSRMRASVVQAMKLLDS